MPGLFEAATRLVLLNEPIFVPSGARAQNSPQAETEAMGINGHFAQLLLDLEACRDERRETNVRRGARRQERPRG